MTEVTAYQITKVSHRPEMAACLDWCGHTKHTEIRTAFYSYNGTDGLWVDMDAVDGKVGDWVVVWPSDYSVVYREETFNKNFTHKENDTFTTKLQGIQCQGKVRRNIWL